MISKDLLSQVRKIEIRTRRVVDDITGGAYHSVFKGRGIEFDEVREYMPEDDVRDIDWNVTARMGAPFVKKYVEERELTVMLVVDISASVFFGSSEKSKVRNATEIAALLAFSAIRNNDRVGLLLFSDQTEFYLPPKSGKTHGMRLIRELMVRKPSSKGTDIGKALNNLMSVLHKKTVVFLISDFIDDGDYAKLLMVANKRHDIIATRILDPVEIKMKKTANLFVEDAETGEIALFPGRSMHSLARFAESAETIHSRAEEMFKKSKVDLIDFRCGEDIVKPLVGFFKRRRKVG
jgi:uncharacterized protein (DUF58 family)